jgi:putative phosphoribosyl transferase
MKFADREAAGRQLATKLSHLRDRQPVVLALPRGGVAVGSEIARALDAPLDIVLVRKIGVPWQPELALGAVTDGALGVARLQGRQEFQPQWECQVVMGYADVVLRASACA